MKCISAILIGLWRIVLHLASLVTFYSYFLIFRVCLPLFYPPQLSLCLKMEKPKSMCLIMESAVQIVILSTLTQHRPYLEMRYFWKAIPFHQCGDLCVKVRKKNSSTFLCGRCCKTRQHNKSILLYVSASSKLLSRLATVFCFIYLFFSNLNAVGLLLIKFPRARWTEVDWWTKIL